MNCFLRLLKKMLKIKREKNKMYDKSPEDHLFVIEQWIEIKGYIILIEKKRIFIVVSP